MNNKETLQEYNSKLIQNNNDLQNVIDIINNLPTAEGGEVSDDLGEKYVLETGYPTSGTVQNQPVNVYIKGFSTIPAYMFGNPESTTLYNRGSRLTDVVIDGNTVGIGHRAFYQCSRLVNITLPDTITRIEGYAFTTCKKMLLDKLPPNLTALSGNSIFNYCQAITIKTIPDGVTSITGSQCFANCTALTQMSMNNVTTIVGSSAYNGVFWNCTGLKAVWIGAKITSIGSYAFQDCSSLKKIYIDLPRATVEAMTGYDKAWSYISSSEGQTLTTDIIVCNDDDGFITKEEFDAKDWTKQEYVSDGMVAWFDGYDEMDEQGHWNNRLGDDYIYITNPSGATSMPRSNNGYVNSKNYALVTSGDYYHQDYTIEVVGKINSQHNSNGDSGGWLFTMNETASWGIGMDNSGTNGRILFINNGSHIAEKTFDGFYGKTFTAALNITEYIPRKTSGKSTNKASVNACDWFNVSETAGAYGNAFNSHGVMCYYPNAGSKYMIDGTLYCIRIYNRLLTVDELKQNYELDKQRFNFE